MKPFRLWDGEGRTIDGKHRFILLANSDGEYIENENGLHTSECIRFLTRKRSKAHNVWFSFGYDVNKILEDLELRGPRHTLEDLWQRGRTWWYGVFIKYIPRKFFTLRYNTDSFVSTDTFSFFQESFLKACKRWQVDASSIVAGKEGRADFASWSLDAIREYNFDELRIGLELLEALRGSLQKANLEPQSWHGPGAIATRWLQRENLSVHYGSWPAPMQLPVMHAYFGGRIDCSLLGEVDAWKSDIASAYPAGLCDCISLAPITWELSDDPQRNDRHALYHVVWNMPRGQRWYPFPWRNKHGSVLFPHEGEGWYWGVEVLAAEKLFPGIVRLEAFYPQGERLFPFKSAIERDYLTRQEVGGKTGLGIAIKLGINSIYGKLAQHISSKVGQKPRWQNYVWAGYTTAFTRARILEAMKAVGPDNMLAIMTDGVFTRVPIPGSVTSDRPELGVWENEGLHPTLFVAPGLYTVFGDDGKPQVVKMRGMPSSINYGWILRQWGCTTRLDVPDAKGVLNDSFKAKHDTFIGMGKALHQNKPLGVFIEEERELHDITTEGTSKRFPHPLQVAVDDPWREFELLPRPRSEPCISYPYSWHPEFEDNGE